MATAAEVSDMFVTFIRSEDEEVATGIQSDWYASNWHRLTPCLNMAPALLSDELLERLYVHLLRHGILPARATLKDTYPVLERAYRVQTQYMQRPGTTSATLLDRFDGLFLFGFDHTAAIAANAGVDDYLRYRAAYGQFGKYWHIPGIAKGAKGLRRYAEDPQVVERICRVMDALGFIHDDRYDPASPHGDEYYRYTRLPFWAAMFTLMLSRAAQARATVQAFAAAAHLPRRAEQMEIFGRLEESAQAHERLSKVP